MAQPLLFAAGTSGIEVAREIRKRRPGLKILLTSGHGMKTAPDRADGGEGFEVLRKPYPKHDLAAKLRKILTAE